MKTAKFLAMIMAASALTFTFTSCGDDEDEPLPVPAPAVTNNGPVAIGELRAFNQSGFFCYGIANPVVSNHIELMLLETDPNDLESLMNSGSSLMLDLRGVYTDAEGHIPTGTYPFEGNVDNGDLEQWDEGYKRCFVIHGGVAKLAADGSIVSGFGIEVLPGCGALTVERSGDDYTLTISSLKMEATDFATDAVQEINTSFTYKGKFMGIPHMPEDM